MRRIASRVSTMTGEGALAVFARATELERSGRSIIHLELGEPDFHPDLPVVIAAKAALDAGEDRYCSPSGLPALQEALALYLRRSRNLNVRPQQAIIAPGCKMALFLSLCALVEPGDEVLYPDPGFPMYPSISRSLGARPVPFGLALANRLQPDIEEIEAKITSRTRVILLNSPGNPTGTVYEPGVQKQLAELAKRHDLWVISDEIYARIVYGKAYESIATLPGMAERTLIVDGFSKSFGMTGWRLGYTIVPDALIAPMQVLIVNTFTCASQFIQLAAVQALRDANNMVGKRVAEFQRRRDAFVRGLNQVPGFQCHLPEGAFYAWVNVVETGMTGEAVCDALLEDAGVAAIPGAAFGAGGRDFIRFSFASSAALLQEALGRIHNASRKWQSPSATAALSGAAAK